MITSSGSKMRSASSRAWSGSASPRCPRAGCPAAVKALTDASRRSSASAWRRSRSDVSQCSRRLRASAGATTITSAAGPAAVADLVHHPARGAGLVRDDQDPPGARPGTGRRGHVTNVASAQRGRQPPGRPARRRPWPAVGSVAWPGRTPWTTTSRRSTSSRPRRRVRPGGEGGAGARRPAWRRCSTSPRRPRARC